MNKFGEDKWPWAYIIVNLRGEKESALAYIILISRSLAYCLSKYAQMKA